MATAFRRLKQRIASYRDRRPHRSFRLTRRRDALRPLKLPGYIAFTKRVNSLVWKNKRPFFALASIYIIIYALLVGIGSQESYDTTVSTLQESGQGLFDGDWGELGMAGILFMSAAATGFNETPTDVQQIIMAIMVLLAWLSTVWLLRNAIAGRRVSARDALYGSGAPIVPTIILTFVLILQFIPVALAIFAYSAADATGLITAGGIEGMLFWAAVSLLTLLSFYWMSSTLFAMIIATLPGTYPMKALSIAGDMVIGRRVKVLLRFLWMMVSVFFAWAIVLIPVILFDSWLKSMWPAIAGVPIVPFALLVVASLTTFWVSSYIYLLYRNIVDGDAKDEKDVRK